jgi:Zn finger protein HypA/HybF involved in hydrogenase expression
MRRVHRNAREARLKCIDCNKPLVRTVAGAFACIECGESPIDVQAGDVTDLTVVRREPTGEDEASALLSAQDDD